MSSDSINYAEWAGYHSLAAAIIFAVVYGILQLFWVSKAIRRPTFVFFVLAIFCAVRITAFTIRAVLVTVDSAAHNLGLIIATTVLFNLGVVAPIYSTYNLILDRQQLLPSPPHLLLGGTIGRLLLNRHVVRLFLSIAVALGITAGNMSFSDDADKRSTGNSLRTASVAMLLGSVVVIALMAFSLMRGESTSGVRERSDRIGDRYGAMILLGIALLLVLREGFFIGTLGALEQQRKESLWYPLSALPELLAVVLFATPGLIPLKRKETEHEMGYNKTGTVSDTEEERQARMV